MSVGKHRDFLDYWDSRFDENEKILNSYTQLANFTFRECNRLWDRMSADYAALLARHNALMEAVEWERETDECGEWLHLAWWDNPNIDLLDIWDIHQAARAEVDRLLPQEKP